jgi:hypothetical protein
MPKNSQNVYLISMKSEEKSKVFVIFKVDENICQIERENCQVQRVKIRPAMDVKP